VTTTTPDAPAAPPFPDWDTISHDVTCPLCGYNLRGLTEARCPECGSRFHWPDVIDPHKGLHPYLFEHHPERNCRSFAQTLVGTLRPARFWASLSPTQPLRPRRMRIYWLLTALIAILALVGEAVRAVVEAWADARYAGAGRFAEGWIPWGHGKTPREDPATDGASGDGSPAGSTMTNGMALDFRRSR